MELPDANPSIAPNLDSELDAALNKSFPGRGGNDNPEPAATNEPPTEPKPNPEVKADLKPEVKPEAPKAPEASTPPKEEKPILSQEQIEKLDPKEKGAWGAIKNANKQAHQIIVSKDAEISKLKAAIAEKSSSSQKEVEAIRAEKKELEKYRAMIDIQADPDFISQYDKPIEASTTGVKDILKKLGVSDEALGNLDFKDTETLDRLVAITQEKDRFTATKLQRKIQETVELMDKRDETLSNQQKNYKETLEQKKKESFAKGAEHDGRMIKHIEAKTLEKSEDGRPMIPFLNKMEPKEGATPAEIDETNRHNALVDALSQKLQEAIKIKDPEHQAEVAIAAVASHFFVNQNKVLAAELKKVKEELAKVAAVSSEAPKRKATPASNGNGEYIDGEQAVDKFFANRR